MPWALRRDRHTGDVHFLNLGATSSRIFLQKDTGTLQIQYPRLCRHAQTSIFSWLNRCKIHDDMPSKSRPSRTKAAKSNPSSLTIVPSNAARRPLIFISHDHRDSKLAEHFSNLLTDASGGTLKSFRSSDKKGRSGIEFGTEWYSEIMAKMGDATDVVALLTSNSIGRPWILFEAGMAKGKLGTPVFGVVVGLAMDQAVIGPFAQFQNSGDDEDSLTKLVLQLIRRNPDAEPREEAVRKQVAVFRDGLGEVITETQNGGHESSEKETNDAAKLFEEVKVLFSQFSERMDSSSKGSNPERSIPNEKRHSLNAMLDASRELDPALRLLMIFSLFREDAPWIYEAGMDVYRAMQTGNLETNLTAVRRVSELIRAMDSPAGQFLIRTSTLRQAIGYASDMVSIASDALTEVIEQDGQAKKSRRKI